MSSIKIHAVCRSIRNVSLTRNGMAGGIAVVSTTLSSFQFTGRVNKHFGLRAAPQIELASRYIGRTG
jgi:hypothetical protein